ncbi:MAG: RagB/SusD family nutrient uptake outer membrane protein [Parabacteroides sp.]|nr:RagB/SusD family nutrient uptake outer membrane protein [Eubacteriales bacterium]MDD4589982.1 RagB/SusD family nutrient uptake outer membrane protein [Parabacteroides sp.]
MKNIFKYCCTIFLSILLLFACVDLDLVPYDQISENSFWQDEKQANQGVMGLYSQLKNYYIFGKAFLTEAMSDIGLGVYEMGYRPFSNGTYTGRTSTVEEHWKQGYGSINRTNTAIRKINEIQGLDEEVRKQLIGETKFLRALFYFRLMDYFGGVPIYDETTDVTKEFNTMLKPRNSVEEVRDFIIKDLTEAIEYLPVNWSQDNYGRATKGAAYALRGKIYLYAEEWEKAIGDFEEIVYNKTNDYGYELYDSYADLFKLTGHNAPEMIFAIQNKGGKTSEYGMPMAFYLGNRSTFVSDWNVGMPSTSFADSYENLDGTPFNWDDYIPGFNESNEVKETTFWSTFWRSPSGYNVWTSLCDTTLLGNIYRGRDPRMMQTLIVPYSYFLGWVNDAPQMMQYAVAPYINENYGFLRGDNGWYAYYWRKFVPEGNLDDQITDRANTPINFPLIRLGDVLLMLSEAYNETGEIQKAVAELNKVRSRSNMPGLNSGPAWLQVDNKEEMFKRIMHERAVELACEGHRHSDLKRWGLLETLNDKVEKDLLGENLYTKKFTSRDYLWPIPSQELDANPNIKQNPGWY